MGDVVKFEQPDDGLVKCACCYKRFKPRRESNNGYCGPSCALADQKHRVTTVVGGDAHG